MTPERAEAIAKGAFPRDVWSGTHDEFILECVKIGILQACAEQKEADAKIAETLHCDPMSNWYAPWLAHGGDIATAIRSAP